MSHKPIKKNLLLEQATQHWKYVAPLLSPPKNDVEYDLLVEYLDELLEIVGSNENHQLIGLVDILSNLISSYDEEHFQLSKTKGVDALKYLMQTHELNQSDLPEIGSQGVISEILNGKRRLNLRQIKVLAKLFKVKATTFIDEKK